MATFDGPNEKHAELRKRALQRIGKPANSEGSDKPSELRRFIEELRIHQVELELQNEELRQARAELERAYQELFDLAPVGYFALGPNAAIQKTNAVGANLLGQSPMELVGKSFASFVSLGSLNAYTAFLERVMGRNDTANCSVILTRGASTGFTAYLKATGRGRDLGCLMAVLEINGPHSGGLP